MYWDRKLGERRGVGLAGLIWEGVMSRGEGRWGGAASLIESTSAVVLPKRVILKRGREDGRAVSGMGWKGCFCIPGLGDMRSFWFGGGMERRSDMEAERSWRVEVEVKTKIWFFPRWWTVRVISFSWASSGLPEGGRVVCSP